jgi:hypothetical protein
MAKQENIPALKLSQAELLEIAPRCMNLNGEPSVIFTRDVWHRILGHILALEQEASHE